jgi:hypothetical protein
VEYLVRSVTNLGQRVNVRQSEPEDGAPAPAVDQIIARVQRLCEAPRSHGAFPIASSVEAYLLGDSTAIIAAKLRAEGLHKV